MFLGQVCFWSPINRYNISRPGSGSQGLLLHASPTHTHAHFSSHSLITISPWWRLHGACVARGRIIWAASPLLDLPADFGLGFNLRLGNIDCVFCFSPRLARHICVLLARSVDIHVAGVMLLAILGILISKTRAEKVKFRFVFRETTYDLMIVWSCFP